jgi:hypothetical protein
VLYLQQELAKQQTLEQQRFKQALEKQRLETQMAASEKVNIKPGEGSLPNKYI